VTVGLDVAWRERAAAWELLSREAFDGFGPLLDRVQLAPDTEQVLRAGARIGDAHYAGLRATQRGAVDRLARLLNTDVDLLLLPLDGNLPDPADRRHDVTVPSAAETPTDLSLTMLASFARLPVAALPVGRSSEGAPLGVQLVARRGAEELLIAAAELVAALCPEETS
jgi:Asp-tRNA(Asn)/Glu-tRNA(Gln) amidotransferase A subunit family amidase